MKRPDRSIQLRLHAEVKDGLQIVYIVARVRRWGMWIRVGAALLGLYDAEGNEEAFRGDMAVALARVRRYARFSRRHGDPPPQATIRDVVA